MNICISWATWFLWKELTHRLLQQWHQISILTRSKSKAEKIFSHVNIAIFTRDQLNTTLLTWSEVVVHLSWAPLFHFPWSNSYKQKISGSRILTTKKLVQLLPSSCHTFICGSAIWYYPSSLTTVYDESYINTSPNNFLESVCVDRELQAAHAKTITRRVISLRTWIVEWNQWMKKQIIQATKCFGWVVLGSWDQYLSLISHASRCNKVIHCINTPELQWAVNLVDYTITMSEYIHKIAKETNRFVRLTIPTKIVSLILWWLNSLLLDSHIIKSIYFKNK